MFPIFQSFNHIYTSSYEEGYFRDVIDLLDFSQKLELYLFEGFSHNRKYLRDYFFVAFANLALKFLGGD
jgi:hypothetical protein